MPVHHQRSAVADRNAGQYVGVLLNPIQDRAVRIAVAGTHSRRACIAGLAGLVRGACLDAARDLVTLGCNDDRAIASANAKRNVEARRSAQKAGSTETSEQADLLLAGNWKSACWASGYCRLAGCRSSGICDDLWCAAWARRVSQDRWVRHNLGRGWTRGIRHKFWRCRACGICDDSVCCRMRGVRHSLGRGRMRGIRHSLWRGWAWASGICDNFRRCRASGICDDFRRGRADRIRNDLRRRRISDNFSCCQASGICDDLWRCWAGWVRDDWRTACHNSTACTWQQFAGDAVGKRTKTSVERGKAGQAWSTVFI